MAEFKDILALTLGHEGFYANHANDKGGETYMGIARNYHPEWEGWKRIDAEKKKLGVQKLPTNYKLSNNDEMQKLATEFYKKKFWQGNGVDRIKNANVAQYLFDWSMGSGGAPNEVRKMLKQKYGLEPNGEGMKYSAEDARLINQLEPEQLLKDLRETRLNYYQTLVKRRPANSSFIKGWVRRANASPAFDWVTGSPTYEEHMDFRAPLKPEEKKQSMFTFNDRFDREEFMQNPYIVEPQTEEERFAQDLVSYKYGYNNNAI